MKKKTKGLELHKISLLALIDGINWKVVCYTVIITSVIIGLIINSTLPDCSRVDYCEEKGFNNYHWENSKIDSKGDYDFFCLNINNQRNTNGSYIFVMDSQYKEWKEKCMSND